MLETVCNRRPRVGDAVGSIHRLEPKMAERQILQAIRRQPILWVDQLQFVSLLHDERRARLWADADPIEARGRANRSVGFDSNHEAALMQRRDEIIIDLQKRLAAGENDEAAADVVAPDPGDHSRQFLRVRKAASKMAVRTDKIGVAERAYRVLPISGRESDRSNAVCTFCDTDRFRGL